MELNDKNMYGWKKEDDAKVLARIAKYLQQGVYQDFQKIRLIKVCFYFSLIVIFFSAFISVRYPNEQIHFLKEVCRWCMNIVFSLLSYLMGRKQERDTIRGKLSIDDEQSTLADSPNDNRTER